MNVSGFHANIMLEALCAFKSPVVAPENVVLGSLKSFTCAKCRQACAELGRRLPLGIFWQDFLGGQSFGAASLILVSLVTFSVQSSAEMRTRSASLSNP